LLFINNVCFPIFVLLVKDVVIVNLIRYTELYSLNSKLEKIVFTANSITEFLIVYFILMSDYSALNFSVILAAIISIILWSAYKCICGFIKKKIKN